MDVAISQQFSFLLTMAVLALLNQTLLLKKRIIKNFFISSFLLSFIFISFLQLDTFLNVPNNFRILGNTKIHDSVSVETQFFGLG